jgi:transposase
MTAVTVLSGPERRRRWTMAEKLRIVKESLATGVNLAEFARRRDIHPHLLHAWRKQARTGLLSGSSDGEAGFAQVAVVSAADAAQSTTHEAMGAAVVEVLLRNGRVLRLSERVTPAHAARLADALEGSGG